MLAVIRCENQQNGIAGIFSRQKYYLDSVNEGEIKFMILTVKGGKRINWGQAAHILGENGKNVLLEQGLSFPEESGLRLADGTPYKRRMLYRAAEKLLRQSASLKRKSAVLLADENMEFINEAELVLHYGGSLTIASDRGEYCHALPKQSVTTVPFSELKELSDYTLILAPVLTQRFADRMNETARTAVLTADMGRNITIEGMVMTDFYSPLPEYYAAFLPAGIDQSEFAAALYTFCGAKSLGELVPNQCAIYLNGNKVAARADF